MKKIFGEFGPFLIFTIIGPLLTYFLIWGGGAQMINDFLFQHFFTGGEAARVGAGPMLITAIGSSIFIAMIFNVLGLVPFIAVVSFIWYAIKAGITKNKLILL